ncbi:MAG: flagellar export chaperone FliS [Nocardioides sp.]
MNASARNAYMGGMVTTASPARLLVMLFERLGADVDRAIAAQQAGEHNAAGPHLIHAQEIVLELRSSLDHDVWDGAARLDDIYSWLYRELIRANTSRDVAVTQGCKSVVDPLVETWREAALASVAAG